MSDTPKITDNTTAHQYEIHADGWVSFLRYRMVGDAIEYLHSETPEEIQGRGYAGAIAKFALDRDLSIGRRVIPTCPFVKVYIDRHPEYAPLVTAK
jgi:predicted GNAT family acetyltransferase